MPSRHSCDVDPAAHPLLSGETRPDVVAVIGVGTDGLRPSGSEGLWVDSERWVAALGGDLPYDVLLRLTFDGMSTRCAEVRFVERPDRQQVISVSGIRGVPLGSLIARALHSNPVVYREREGEQVASFVTTESQERRRVRDRVQNAAHRRTPDEDLEKVAEVYEQAVLDGRPPTAAVERALRLTNRNQAKKWVSRARRAGFLPPAPGERRGGIVR